MVKVILEVADNGIIKKIVDDNYNGAGEKLEKTKLYDFENDIKYKTLIKFFYQLVEDLDIDTGNNYDKENLVLTVDWGSKYNPDANEIKNRIKLKKLEIDTLNELLKQSKINENEGEKTE